MGIDLTLHAGDIIAILVVLLPFGVKVLLNQRDLNSYVRRTLGQDRPRDNRYGLLGDVADLKDHTELTRAQLGELRRALGYDRRTHDS